MLLANKLQRSSHSGMSLFVSMAGDRSMAHALFATALTEKTEGSIRYSYALPYKVDRFFFLVELPSVSG